MQSVITQGESSPRSAATAADAGQHPRDRVGLSVVEKACANVKRWHPGDQRERWVGSGLLVAEKQFRRVRGHKLIPLLLRQLDTLTLSKVAVVKRRKAS